jgi:hypothetical protein
MDLILESRNGFLLATVSGIVSLNGAADACRNACHAAASMGLTKMLIDCFALDGDLRIEERIELGKAIARNGQSFIRIPNVALVGRPPSVTGVCAMIAANRGMDVKIFSNRTAAQDWLRSLP